MDFPLPPVGEGLFEVELIRWLVRPGDAVSRGQGLAEVILAKHRNGPTDALKLSFLKRYAKFADLAA
jgi:replicative DNA helicase